MASDGDQNPEPEWLLNLPLRAEEIGFSPDELVECKKCGKANPPNRPTCLYCANEIGGVAPARIDLRELDDWENGFNVVLIRARGADVDRAAFELASLLKSEKEFLQTIFSAGRSIPIARVELENQARAISEKLAAFGIGVKIIPDEELQPSSPPARLRSIAIDDGELKLQMFGSNQVEVIKRDQLALIVPGLIIAEKTESIERRKRRSTKTLNSTATSADAQVIDVYSSENPTGWRIPPSGFDFSCLGSEKALLVANNMNTLVARLVEFSPTAKLIDDYQNVRSMLEHAWPTEARRDTNRLGVGRKKFSSVFTTNNMVQFTKYSRMQWRLYEKEV
jgi:hypothetical protein